MLLKTDEISLCKVHRPILHSWDKPFKTYMLLKINFSNPGYIFDGKLFCEPIIKFKIKYKK